MHDEQDTSRIFYPGSFSSLIDSIGEKHGETGFNPLGGFSSPSSPRHPRFRQPTAVTRRQNQPPSEQKRQPLFAVSLSPVPFSLALTPLAAVILSRARFVSTPLFFPRLYRFLLLRCFPSRAQILAAPFFRPLPRPPFRLKRAALVTLPALFPHIRNSILLTSYLLRDYAPPPLRSFPSLRVLRIFSFWSYLKERL